MDTHLKVTWFLLAVIPLWACTPDGGDADNNGSADGGADGGDAGRDKPSDAGTLLDSGGFRSTGDASTADGGPGLDDDDAGMGDGPEPTVTTATPVSSPEGGELSYLFVNVELTSSTPGAKIYYNLGDGSQAEPTASDTLYESVFWLTKTTTVKAIALSDALPPSPVLAVTFPFDTVALPYSHDFEDESIEGWRSTSPQSLSLSNGAGADSSVYSLQVAAGATVTRSVGGIPAEKLTFYARAAADANADYSVEELSQSTFSFRGGKMHFGYEGSQRDFGAYIADTWYKVEFLFEWVDDYDSELTIKVDDTQRAVETGHPGTGLGRLRVTVHEGTAWIDEVLVE